MDAPGRIGRNDLGTGGSEKTDRDPSGYKERGKEDCAIVKVSRQDPFRSSPPDYMDPSGA